MTRKDLEQLRGIKQEIAAIEKELAAISGDTYVADTYKDYSTGRGVVKVVRGYGMADGAYKKQQKLKKRLARKLEELQDRLAEMEDWLDDIEDPTMRTILRLYYRNGLTQEQIGEEIGYSRSGARNKIDEFWEKQKQKPGN